MSRDWAFYSVGWGAGSSSEGNQSVLWWNLAVRGPGKEGEAGHSVAGGTYTLF